MEDSKKLGSSDLLMLVTVVIWAFNFSVLKLSLPAFPSAHAFNFLRLLLSCLILFPILFLREGPTAVGWGTLWRLAAVGIMGNCLYQIFFIDGLQRTTASNTSLILTTTPVFVALLSLALGHDRLPWAGWLGIAVSFLGLYLVITHQSGAFRLGLETVRGDLMILSGNIFWSLYTVLSKPLLKRVSPLSLTTWTLAAGTLAYFPAAAPSLLRMNWGRVTPAGWAGLSFSAAFSFALGYVIWYTSVRRVGNSRTAVYNNLTPVLTAVFAHFLLRERLADFPALGAAIILAGVTLTRLGPRFFLWKKKKEI